MAPLFTSVSLIIRTIGQNTIQLYIFEVHLYTDVGNLTSLDKDSP
jgi:hypothetical protein